MESKFVDNMQAKRKKTDAAIQKESLASHAFLSAGGLTGFQQEAESAVNTCRGVDSGNGKSKKALGSSCNIRPRWFSTFAALSKGYATGDNRTLFFACLHCEKDFVGIYGRHRT